MTSTFTSSVPSTQHSPDPAQTWDKIWSREVSPQKDEAQLDRERRSPRWRMVVERIERHFGRLDGLRSIELGSGRGDLSVLLAQRGVNATLFDNNQKALDSASARFARHRLSATFQQGDLLAFPDSCQGAHDIALSVGVIEHFKGETRTETLRAHWNALRPGGLAIVTVPNAHCPPYRLWKWYLEARGVWPYGMEIPYTREELLTRGREAGFVDIEVRAVGLWQSVGDHLWPMFLGRRRDWVDRPSRFDGRFGSVLIFVGRKPKSESGNTPCETGD